MTTERIAFPESAEKQLAVATSSGDVTVVGEARDDVEVGGVRRDRIGSRLGVQVGPEGRIDVVPAKRSQDIEIRCPEGTDVMVGTTSGKVILEGRLGEARVTTVSGSVSAEEVENLDVRGVSGTVEVEECHGRCRIRAKSGTVRIERAGSVEVGTVSGTVEVGHVAGTVRIKGVSSTIDVTAGGEGDVDVHSISGSVSIALPAGVRPDLHIHTFGKVRRDVEEGHDCRVRVKSASGSVTLTED
jgi:DUF4097 and DUF4098 domain-containing protein YvlB